MRVQIPLLADKLAAPFVALGPRVLSVQASILGHRTYAHCLRRYFEGTSGSRVDSIWQDQDREWSARLLVRLLTRNLPGGWAQAHNLDLRRLRTELGDAYLARRLAVRHLHKTSYQCLHFHTQVHAFLSPDLMARIPTVLTGDMTAVQASQEKDNKVWPWTCLPNIALDRKVLRVAAAIAPWSEWAARSVVSDYGINPDKVHPINPGVDLAAFEWARERQEVPRREGPVRLLFVGGDFERKGGCELRDVFLERLAAHAELHLVTGGEVGVTHPRVHVHRHVTSYSPEWRALYEDADVFVLPTHREAFGLVFMEAMAAGLPVVGSRLNAIPEMVTHGETGLLVTPGDREGLAQVLQALIDDPALRRRMGSAGRRFAERRFDAQTNFQQLDALFQKVAVPVPQA